MERSTSALCVVALVAFFVSPVNGWWVIAGIAIVAAGNWIFWSDDDDG